MLIGYARVSTDNQDTAAQVAALEAAGCERIFREKASGGHWERPQFLRLLNHHPAGRSGRVDRLGQPTSPGVSTRVRPVGAVREI